MPRKQATSNDSSAGAAAARAAKPKAPRVKSAQHTKAAASQDAIAPQVQIEMIEVVSPVAVLEVGAFPVEAALSASARPDVDPREEIARLAYGYWLARGCTGGDPVEDWVRAENEYYAGSAI
jgi:hypothetical protein